MSTMEHRYCSIVLGQNMASCPVSRTSWVFIFEWFWPSVMCCVCQVSPARFGQRRTITALRLRQVGQFGRQWTMATSRRWKDPQGWWLTVSQNINGNWKINGGWSVSSLLWNTVIAVSCWVKIWLAARCLARAECLYLIGSDLVLCVVCARSAPPGSASGGRPQPCGCAKSASSAASGRWPHLGGERTRKGGGWR